MVLLKLYWSFLLIGFSSFGGLSMIPQISDQVITNGWMTVSQVTDILSITEMTPGPLGLNCATFAGIQAAGIPGAVVANLGILTPTFTLGTLVAVFFFRYKDNRMMEKLLTGIRPACLGMVFGVLLSIMRSTYITESSASRTHRTASPTPSPSFPARWARTMSCSWATSAIWAWN